MNKRVFTLVLSILLSLMAGLATNVKDYTFTHLGIEDGVAGPHIFSICQTGDGVVWWSTKNTVDRYNGRSVKNYLLDEDAPYSLFGGRTVGIVISSDGKNNLYAFDNKGNIFLYEGLKDSFEHVADASAILGNSSVMLNHIYVDRDGIWMAFDSGTFFLSDGKLIPILEGHATNYILRCDQTFLLCTVDGVFRVESPSAQPQFFNPCTATSAYYDSVSGRIWLGTFSSGLRVIDKYGDFVCNVKNIPINPVRCIIPFDKETVLVGVDGFGVYAVPADVTNAEASLFIHANEGSSGVLHGNGIYSLLKDKWGNLFIGTYSGGVDIARPTGDIAQIYRYTQDVSGSVNNNHVNCVADVPGYGLVVGTDNGVSVFSSGNWHHFANGLVVLDIVKDGDNLLLATFGEGVYKLNKQGRASRLYSVAGGQLRSDHVYSFCRSADGNLWMGCLSGSLVERTPSGFRHYSVQNVQDIVQLPDGRMAVGTSSGISIITPGRTVVESLQYSIPGQSVNVFAMNLLVDGNNLWIGSDGGGVYIFDLKTGECRQITKKDGLPGNGITSMVKGNDGTFWVCTENGLGSVGADGKVTSHNHIWELNREYVRGASVMISDGMLLLGSTDGAVLLNPGRMEKASYDAPLHLIGAQFNAKNEQEYEEKMARLLSDDPQLKLRFKDNTFELFFESVNLRYQQDISYQYSMDNGKWSRPSKEGHFRFAKIESGSHSLLVRSVSSNANMVLDQMKVNVTVAPPVWNTWWMWTIYVLIIIGAFVGAWKIYQLHSRYLHLVLSNPAIQANSAPDSRHIPRDGNGKEFVDSVTRIVVEHISESDFSIDSLCREMGMSRTYLYVRLKGFTGESPQDFIRIIRMERAAMLLRSGEAVASVAEAVGFDNPKYFSTVFKKYFEVSPSKYR